MSPPPARLAAPDLADLTGRIASRIVLIAAVSENGIIGRDNALPWRLPSDLQHFRAVTMGKPVVMGRKTWLSIGRPLPGRTVIVVSRDRGLSIAGVVVASSLVTALEVAHGDALRRRAAEICIVGGNDLFTHLMPFAQRIELTRVHAKVSGDVTFPDIDSSRWHEVARRWQAAGVRDDADMTFITYELSPNQPGRAL